MAAATPGTREAPGTRAAPAAASTPIERCTGASLRTTAQQLPGAAEDNGYRIRFTDTARRSCTLAGYPRVVGVSPGQDRAELARDTSSAHLGQSKPSSPRAVVVLRADGGFASAVVTAVGNPTAQTRCHGNGPLPLEVRELWIQPPGVSRVAVVQARMLVCSRFVTSPVSHGA